MGPVLVLAAALECPLELAGQLAVETPQVLEQPFLLHWLLYLTMLLRMHRHCSWSRLILMSWYRSQRGGIQVLWPSQVTAGD